VHVPKGGWVISLIITEQHELESVWLGKLPVNVITGVPSGAGEMSNTEIES
jgi:hypothetical protein